MVELASNTQEFGGDLAPFTPGQIAVRAAEAFSRGVMSNEERSAALEVFRWLACHTEADVRQSFAEHIKSSPLLPDSIAFTLAQDIESVATPILRTSLALSDRDLLAIVEAGSTEKQCAIAARDTVSEVVSSALVDTGKQSVVEILLANDGAEISETSYRKLLDAFAEEPDIHKLLVERRTLPFAVQERLVVLVCEELRARLVDKHSFPATLADQLARHGRERALARSLATLDSAEEIEAAAMRLHLNGSLTATLLLRVLCTGQLEFVGTGFATLARVSASKAQKVLREAGTPALQSLYRKTGLPDHLQKAFQVVLEIVLQARRAKGSTIHADVLEQHIVDDLVRAYRRLSPDGLESVMFQIGRLTEQD